MRFLRSKAEDRIVLRGEPDVEVTLRRSARARRLSLRISHLDGRVTMTLPKNARLREAQAFAQEKEGWIRDYLQQRPQRSKPGIGSRIMWRGHEIPIGEGAGRSARLVDGILRVPPEPDRQAIRIAAFLKNAAREQLVAATEHYAEQLGCGFGKISLRDPRSRWGSCSSQGNLMYSWRLVMAPSFVLEYVAAHEVAHLIELNHSPAYWQVVERVFPDHRTARQWLRRHGPSLHRYVFKD